ncbi:MAG: deoxyribonuclease V [Candidatus Brocadiia bacterium]
MELSEPLHNWNVSYERARKIQEDLAGCVKQVPLPDDIKIVAGADMSFSKKAKKFFAGVVVMKYPEMEAIEEKSSVADAAIPYIPGLLTFREGPAVISALERIQHTPDVVIFDGQGIAHPRRMGLGAHLGLWLDMPTVGCAKSRLVGEYEMPGEEKGEWEPLYDEGERIGSVLRTRRSVKPVFVSPGHLCDHKGARELVLDCAIKYRLPEPTRQADHLVARVKKKFLGQ